MESFSGWFKCFHFNCAELWSYSDLNVVSSSHFSAQWPRRRRRSRRRQGGAELREQSNLKPTLPSSRYFANSTSIWSISTWCWKELEYFVYIYINIYIYIYIYLYIVENIMSIHYIYVCIYIVCIHVYILQHISYTCVGIYVPDTGVSSLHV